MVLKLFKSDVDDYGNSLHAGQSSYSSRVAGFRKFKRPEADSRVVATPRVDVEARQRAESRSAAATALIADEEHANAAGEEAHGEPEPPQRLARLHDVEAGAAGAR